MTFCPANFPAPAKKKIILRRILPFNLTSCLSRKVFIKLSRDRYLGIYIYVPVAVQVASSPRRLVDAPESWPSRPSWKPFRRLRLFLKCHNCHFLRRCCYCWCSSRCFPRAGIVAVGKTRFIVVICACFEVYLLLLCTSNVLIIFLLLLLLIL